MILESLVILRVYISINILFQNCWYNSLLIITRLVILSRFLIVLDFRRKLLILSTLIGLRSHRWDRKTWSLIDPNTKLWCLNRLTCAEILIRKFLIFLKFVELIKLSRITISSSTSFKEIITSLKLIRSTGNRTWRSLLIQVSI